MDWILGSGLRFGRLVVALAIGLTVIGIAQLHSAPVDVYPEFMPPSVEIRTCSTGCPGWTASTRRRCPACR
jgi:Cu/Ag efflux pump CusA